MFRMWCKLFTDNHLVKDITIEDSSDVKTITTPPEGMIENE